MYIFNYFPWWIWLLILVFIIILLAFLLGRKPYPGDIKVTKPDPIFVYNSNYDFSAVGSGLAGPALGRAGPVLGPAFGRSGQALELSVSALPLEDKRGLITPSYQLDNILKNKTGTQQNLSISGSPKRRRYRKNMENLVSPVSKRNNFGSKKEYLCCKAVEELFGKPFLSVRPAFLKNPETGSNLEIDCYCDELKLGIEFNGVQHYVWPNFTNHSKEEFIAQVRRDQYKVEACDCHGVYLITVPYNVPESLFKEYIKHYLPSWLLPLVVEGE